MPTPVKLLKPLKLHDLLGHAPQWTDELWEEVVRYLSDRLDAHQAIHLAALLDAGQAEELVPVFFKVDFIRLFRPFPPAMLLGYFDMARQQGIIR